MTSPSMGFSVELPLMPRLARHPKASATEGSVRSSHARPPPPAEHEVAGVVTKPPRDDPRDSVLPKSDSIPTTAPSPAPLGGVDSDAPAPDEETAATRKEANASAEASPAPEKETPASLQPQESGNAGGNG
jgi:hypothetical protein